MFLLMISSSSLKLGRLGSKIRSRGQIKGKPCYHPSSHISEAIIMNLAQNVWLMSWVTWDKKLGHLAKSKEDLVITLEVTFFNQLSWTMLKMFVLKISRSSLKLGHLGSKIDRWAKSKENLFNTIAVTILKQSSWILLKMFVLMISSSGSKLRHAAKH